MELWDVYDRYRVKTGRTMVRGESIKPGDYHLVVHICLFNSEGKMLIQQRQAFKEVWPDRWDVTTAGSALAGESPEQAAERELFEELGIRHDFSEIRPLMTMNFPGGFDDVFLIQRDFDLNTLILQPEEVQAARFADC